MRRCQDKIDTIDIYGFARTIMIFLHSLILKISLLTGLSTVVTHNETARLAGDASQNTGGVLFAAGGCAAAALALLTAAAAAGTLYKRGSKARHHDSIQ